VKVCHPPAQIVALAGLTVQLGVGLTVNVALHAVEHPLESVTVTEYVPAVPAVILGVVAPVFHRYV
jgi:hypothetical protein